jgi:hypothetical protein
MAETWGAKLGKLELETWGHWKLGDRRDVHQFSKTKQPMRLGCERVVPRSGGNNRGTSRLSPRFCPHVSSRSLRKVGHGIGTRIVQVPSSFALFHRLPFALCLSYHFSASATNPIQPIHFARTNYSFKVVFRVFRDLHSVPVKRELCSSWNICTCNRKTASVFQSEHSANPLATANVPDAADTARRGWA